MCIQQEVLMIKEEEDSFEEGAYLRGGANSRIYGTCSYVNFT